MKKMSKRTQVLLAITAVVVVVVVAVVVFFQASGDDLFGTVISITISPSSSTIIVGHSVTLSSGTALSNCSWSSSNTSVASITSSSTKSATVLGKGVGQVTITETCGALDRYHGSASVTVNAPPTPTPTPTPTRTPVSIGITLGPDTGKTVPYIGVNERMTLCASDTSIQWSQWTSSDLKILNVLGSLYAPGCIVVQGVTQGSATVRATSATGEGSVKIYVTNLLTMSPAYPDIRVGQSITMTMTGADSSTAWRILKSCDNVAPANCPVRLSANTGQSVTITGQVTGAAIITANRMPQFPDSLNDAGLTQVIVR